MAQDPLNRVVSPVGDRLRKQRDAITRFEHRERVIADALATFEPAQAVVVIQSVLDGEWDNPALTS